MAGQAAIPILVEGLKARGATVRSQSAIALANLGPNAINAIPDLIKALTDRNVNLNAKTQERHGSPVY